MPKRIRVDFTNKCLRAAFLSPDPKSAKRQSCHQFLFALLGSVRVKAARKMLMKWNLHHAYVEIWFFFKFFFKFFPDWPHGTSTSRSRGSLCRRPTPDRTRSTRGSPRRSGMQGSICPTFYAKLLEDPKSAKRPIAWPYISAWLYFCAYGICERPQLGRNSHNFSK